MRSSISSTPRRVKRVSRLSWKKFKGIVEAHGTLTSVDEWGKRRLAYPINDLIEGYYVYMTCEVTPEMPAELDRVFKITDGILRSIIVAVEE